MPDLYLAWKGADDSDQNVWGIRCATELPHFDPLQQQLQGIDCSSKPALLALSDRILVGAASDFITTGGPPSIETDLVQSAWSQSWPTLAGIQIVPGIASSWAPTLAPWGNGALMVWNGEHNDTRLWCSNYNQVSDNWSTQFLTELESSGKPIQSGSAPAVVNLSGTLLMVWRGEGDNDSLYYATSSDGLHWQGNRAIPGAASTIAPAMTVYNGVAVLCFKGGQNDASIYATAYDRGSDRWEPVVPTGPFGTSHGPSLAVYQSMVFMTWKGVPGDTNLWWATTPDVLNPSFWSGQSMISNAGSSVGPAAVVY